MMVLEASQSSDAIAAVHKASVVKNGAGYRAEPHVHEYHETALYMLSGDEMELWTGDQLQFRDNVRPGDYIFIPANMLHVAVNRGEEPAVFIGSRNEATAQESVVLRPEMDCKVP
jgi:uncharacterized RmlC-like cupin family protein